MSNTSSALDTMNTPVLEGVTAMRPEQLIDRIQTLNPSANPEYLASFDAGELVNYLEHLEYAQAPRGRSACWSRRRETPAVMCRRVTIAA